MMLMERLSQVRLGRSKRAELDRLVTAYGTLGKFSGAVHVAQGGKVLLSKGYGYANLEYEAPNTPQSVFRIGSMTKPFTALATMQLVKDGELSLDDRLERYLPGFPNGNRITLYHLISNRSGIPDYILMPEYTSLSKYRQTSDQIVDLFRTAPLQSEPGVTFAYSNSGWVLLGVVLEQVTGLPYADAIRKRIFEPAGMSHSGYTWEMPVIRGRALGYLSTGDGLTHAELIDETTMHAAGGLYSTVEDLYRWSCALRDGTLISHETLRQMKTPTAESYGCGWELHRIHNHDSYGHSGGLPGYISNFVRFEDMDATIIILSNLGSADISHLTKDLAAILFERPYALPTVRPVVDVAPAILADYVGQYSTIYFGRTSILNLVIDGNRLVMRVNGLPDAVLTPFSETGFVGRSKGEVELVFVREVDGSVNRIDLNWAGHVGQAQRTNA